MNIIQYLTNKYQSVREKDYIDTCLLCAIDYKQYESIKHFAAIGADLDKGMIHACVGTDMNAIRLLIGIGANDYNRYLKTACKSMYIGAIDLMLQLGATNFAQIYSDIAANNKKRKQQNHSRWSAKRERHVFLNCFITERGWAKKCGMKLIKS